MQIKITNTRIHKRSPELNYPDVITTEAKLVLLKTNTNTLWEKSVPTRFGHPIWISETEKIEVGDWVYDKFASEGDEIFKCSFAFPNEGRYYKILVLSEHNSPEQLQMIVDGELKEGDKRLIECEKEHFSHNKCIEEQICQETKGFEGTEHEGVDVCEDGCVWGRTGYQIKLNSSNHVTIHKIEEKMYTRDEVKEILHGIKIELIGRYGCDYFHFNKEWFEQNIK